MDLREKSDFVALGRGHGLENFTAAIPSLCLPSFTLSDGPVSYTHLDVYKRQHLG